MASLKNKNNEVDYTKTISIAANIKLVYKAIVFGIDKWWGTCEGSANSIGSIFKIKFNGDSYWKFEIIDLVENKRIVWKCIESNQDHNLKGIDEEWLHSIVTWELTQNEDVTMVKFMHEGLIPSGICYEVCSTGWDYYLTNSLKIYLETGKGNPKGK